MTIRWVVCMIVLVLFLGVGVYYDGGSTGVSSSSVNETSVERLKNDASKLPIEHVVLCWLKDKNVTDVTALLIEKSQKLRSIPGLVSFRSGDVVKSSRDIVDDSFHVGFVMGFDSKESLDSYITHPTHVSFVNEVLKPVTDKVVVYDIQLR